MPAGEPTLTLTITAHVPWFGGLPSSLLANGDREPGKRKRGGQDGAADPVACEDRPDQAPDTLGLLADQRQNRRPGPREGDADERRVLEREHLHETRDQRRAVRLVEPVPHRRAEQVEPTG